MVATILHFVQTYEQLMDGGTAGHDVCQMFSNSVICKYFALPTRAECIDPIKWTRERVQQPGKWFGRTLGQSSPQARHGHQHTEDEKAESHVSHDLAVRPAWVETLLVHIFFG